MSSSASSTGSSTRSKRLVGGDDLAHLGVDPLEVVVGERRPTGQLEVVVEAVLDRPARRRTSRRATARAPPGPARARWSGGGGSSDSGSRSVRKRTESPSGSGALRSWGSPSTSTTRAAFARPGPIDAARSVPVAPSGRVRTEPSGSVIEMSAIAPEATGCPQPRPGTGLEVEQVDEGPVLEDLGRRTRLADLDLVTAVGSSGRRGGPRRPGPAAAPVRLGGRPRPRDGG